jgi:hypothetical protein
VFDFYRRSAIVLGKEDDAVLESLRAEPNFDLRTLGVAHAHLAAFWRMQNGHVNPSLPGILDLDKQLHEYHDWVVTEATLWIIDNPLLIRLFALVLVQQNTAPGIMAEIDLLDELKVYYPLVPPDQLDLFDDRST